MMFYDYSKRGYLLPPGCKDLIDMLRMEQSKNAMPLYQFGESLEESQEPAPWWDFKSKPSKKKSAFSSPKTELGEITIPEKISVAEIAAMIGQKPFKIIADLMQMDVFTTLHADIDFEVAAKVLRKYGLIAKKNKPS
ncbi:MAG TPA: translation initiation factor IF-2 N-terminal domain-containing protein [Candidatus Dormibacteraeota bacterium]|nr:translation initiation factor IF-2 N-terminal domain-containing protein [Candidatus Dormibacteraeota bacterium]